jgi:hypothetical protein
MLRRIFYIKKDPRGMFQLHRPQLFPRFGTSVELPGVLFQIQK